MPLQHALDTYNQPEYCSVFKANTFFPIVGNGGDFLLLQLKNRLQVFAYSPSLLINKPIAYTRNLGTLLECIASCFEKDIYSVNANNEFESDMGREDFIFKSKNEKTAYWKE